MGAGTAAPFRSALARLSAGSEDRLELVLRVSVAALAIMTVVVVFDPIVHGHAIAPAVDLAMDTAAAVVSGSLTALAWVRFRERRDSIALYHAAAFLVLAVAYAVAVVVSVSRDAEPTTLADPSAPQTIVFAAARLVAAVLLVVGGTAMQRRAALGQPGVLLVIPALGVAVVAGVAYSLGAIPEPLALITADGPGDALPNITGLGVLVQLVSATLFFEAALVCRALWRRDQAVMDAWIAVALVFAAFAEVQWAIYPSGHPGQTSTADLLWLAFFACLLIGIEAEARVTLARLRVLNVELATLREADVDRAALEERARIARELHDGLAQDLWLAKLKTGQLGALPGLPADAAPLLSEAEAAIDSGLTEARQAVLALRMASVAEGGFRDLVRRYVEDFEDRFGLRVEFACEGDPTAIPPRTQAEILRIAQEALTNVRQHAAATVVGMRLVIRHGRVTLRVVDNGCGFDVSREDPRAFGLHSMRERAALIGGRLVIRSRAGEGTSVMVTAPVAPAPAGALAEART